VKKVASGQNVQRAALSTAGNFILNKIQQRTGPIVSGVRGRIPQVPSRLPRGPAAQTFAAALARARHMGIPRGRAVKPTGPIPPRVGARRPQVPSRLPGGPAAQAAFDDAWADAGDYTLPDTGFAQTPPQFPVQYGDLSRADLGAQWAPEGRWLEKDGQLIVLGVYPDHTPFDHRLAGA